jgi:periplasmic copper chaperone A
VTGNGRICRRFAACLVTGLVLVGCGAGQISQTAEQADRGGAGGDAGDTIAVRGVRIPYPPDGAGSYAPGSTVPLVATIVNLGERPDELVEVTSPAATRVSVSGSTRIPPGRNVVADPGAPAAGPVSPLVAGRMQITLVAARVLRAGPDTPVTFRFREAGTVTVAVPMAETPGIAGPGATAVPRPARRGSVRGGGPALGPRPPRSARRRSRPRTTDRFG